MDIAYLGKNVSIYFLLKMRFILDSFTKLKPTTFHRNILKNEIFL